MAINQAEFRTRVRGFARVDETKTAVTDSQLDWGIEAALCEYSLKIPKLNSVNLPASSTGFYTLTSVVPTWDDSRQVKGLLWTDENGEPQQASSSDWSYFSLSVPTLKVISDSPNFQDLTSGNGWLKFYEPRFFDGSGNSNFDKYDENGVIFLAASFACLQAAAETVDEDNSAIAGDVVDYNNQSSQWMDVHHKYMKLWNKHLKCRFESSIEQQQEEIIPNGIRTMGGFARIKCEPKLMRRRFFH